MAVEPLAGNHIQLIQTEARLEEIINRVSEINRNPSRGLSQSGAEDRCRYTSGDQGYTERRSLNNRPFYHTETPLARRIGAARSASRPTMMVGTRCNKW